MAKTKKKPAKPYRDFPLFPHATRRWAKKIRGRMCYFGPWRDPDGALQKFLDQRDDLYAGRKPRPKVEGLTVRDLCNRFLTNRQDRVKSGELTLRSFKGYHKACGRVVQAFGDRPAADLDPSDFAGLRNELARTHGPASLALDIRQVRTTFKWAYESGFLEHPVRFGPDFRAPGEAILRRARQSNGPRMLEAHEIRRLLDAAEYPLRAMIFVGVNCGFGNGDCGRLPLDCLDLDDGWVDFARPKTGIQRRCPLWPETIEALREAISMRPEPKGEKAAELVFLTQAGTSFFKESTTDLISRKFRELAKKVQIHRPGLGFYTLRRVFETIGGDSRDQVAVDHIMGHADGSMASIYRQRIEDDRLRAVVQHVRTWLYGRSCKP